MSKEISIWTVQLSQWRVVKEQKIALLNITAKSGERSFAPFFGDVMKYKNGEMEEEEYTEIYLARMARSQKLFPDKWEMLKEEPRVALACYCRANVFCHRHLFAPLMQKYLEEANFTVTQKGEVIK